ncbi:TetR/AcrR family transcriptional regulator [Pseudomonas chengduensis]|uniref:Transcriptional regulator, TetR family n=1 Tax=Pseudomonas sihuiensis TaxID=1274359 RepID=A0A1H2LSQ3_9PSED|nr:MULTISPECIES: helix-turn-helix domain-containing protein [Pseudomonas]MDH1684081.1 TetR/AcrR family transcriptional regulator [Pseudomonas chengduensis]SDU84033.1 transcriptional regulator, TetR family [Pseudomonas sihuiensis]
MSTAKCMEPTSTPTGSRFARNRPKALQLFAERGFAQVSLRELASHLELTAGSLYNHCSSKEELLLEFIEEHYMAMLSLFDRRYRRESPAATLQVVVQGLVSLHQSHPLHFQLATRETGCLKPNQRLAIDRLRQQLRQQLNSLLCAAGLAAPGQVDAPALELFEHLPLWLASYPLDERQRCAALMRHLTATQPTFETRR